MNPKQQEVTSIGIIPGTELMSDLDKLLEFFVLNKLDTDTEWRDLKVILSNSQVEGEGEHKIMEYLRSQKLQNPELKEDTFCIYGNDSDLILLSLVSHLNNIVIFREQYTNSSESLDTKTFKLQFEELYISLLREYL